jgi:mono/diheme cytochrome c family protein
MNKIDQQEYLDQYKKEKEKGVPFFPNILFKDAVIALLVFLALIALAYFVGAALEAPANPADTNYTPRPEWYFLFLFQLLKYFPPALEVLGVVVLPLLVILLLFILPFLDRSKKRDFRSRPLVIATTGLIVIGIIALSILSVLEAPPPVEAAQGDQTASLYIKNCAGCHGASIEVSPGTNLHSVIAEGKHEGMPPWSADLTSDQIDALAGVILSPGGSSVFSKNCGTCHETSELVASNPLEIKKALVQGKEYPAHADLDIPEWANVITQEERTQLINFLIAPDGQRIFTTNCASCHGKSLAYSGDEAQLRTIISQGGLHLEMPAWQAKLSTQDIDTLANYVFDPKSTPQGADLFQKNCSACHGDKVPKVASLEQAKNSISAGGAHQTMPVWGDILTEEQINALVTFVLSDSQGSVIEAGQTLFADNCAACHGDFGEGGPNPARPGDVIAPISTAEFLKTRDDFSLRAIISQGQPNLGMSPFGGEFGGPLDPDEVDAIVAYLRSWESNPPVELPPEIKSTQASLSGEQIFGEICAKCHGSKGEGGIGPSLSDPNFQAANTDQDILNTISLGHNATAMIGWSDILSQDQIQQLVEFIRNLKPTTPVAGPTLTPTAIPTQGPPSFSADVLPILEDKCSLCHGSMGGWNSTSYTKVMTSGDHAPVVNPGDPDGSLLVQKLIGTHTQGTIMPPGGKLADDLIQKIIDWIAAGALDN